MNFHQQSSKAKSSTNGRSVWLKGFSKRSNVISASGFLEYSYRDLQKGTGNFTPLIDQGAFGPLYKAQMSTGETVAVKVLATDSKQAVKEFQTEVSLQSWSYRMCSNLISRGSPSKDENSTKNSTSKQRTFSLF